MIEVNATDGKISFSADKKTLENLLSIVEDTLKTWCDRKKPLVDYGETKFSIKIDGRLLKKAIPLEDMKCLVCGVKTEYSIAAIDKMHRFSENNSESPCITFAGICDVCFQELQKFLADLKSSKTKEQENSVE